MNKNPKPHLNVKESDPLNPLTLEPKIRPIAQLGNPVLRQQAQAISELSSQATRQLVMDLIATAKKAGGVGIAAPQIGVSLQLFIMASAPNSRYPNAPTMEPTAIFNPKIIESSGDILKDWEGCLSVPAIRGLVPRPSCITVEYQTADNQKKHKQLEGFLARVFQHEFDHLIGLTFLDRVENNKDLMSEQEFFQQIIGDTS
jgi:peptide deformylase